MIATYKRIRATVQTGDLYRLQSPRSDDVTAVQYVAHDGRQSVLFAYRHAQQFRTDPPAIRLRGLDQKAVYQLESTDNKLPGGSRQVSGAYLMSAGVSLNLRGDYDATAVILERQ
jgi:alpha-galactosidase